MSKKRLTTDERLEKLDTHVKSIIFYMILQTALLAYIAGCLTVMFR